MSETRVFADGYRGVFQNQEDFLECLNSIGRNSFWERKTSKNLRLVAITSGSKVEEELKQMYADEGLDEDIIADTIINTGLLLKIRNQYYPVRDCAIKSILDRAGEMVKHFCNITTEQISLLHKPFFKWSHIPI